MFRQIEVTHSGPGPYLEDFLSMMLTNVAIPLLAIIAITAAIRIADQANAAFDRWLLPTGRIRGGLQLGWLAYGIALVAGILETALVLRATGQDVTSMRAALTSLWITSHGSILVWLVWLSIEMRLAGKRLNRFLDRQCPLCKYSLRGIDQEGCPECGWRRVPFPAPAS